jgi:hypothetical protein
MSNLTAIRPLHSFKAFYAFGDWVVCVYDPQRRPLGRYNGFDDHIEAEEWATKVCKFMDERMLKGQNENVCS